jgi:urease accessory protein
VALFALFHGHAHGVEMPEAAAPLLYGAGFALATGLLHGAGVGAALSLRGLVQGRVGAALLRGVGALIGLGGVALVALG